MLWGRVWVRLLVAVMAFFDDDLGVGLGDGARSARRPLEARPVDAGGTDNANDGLGQPLPDVDIGHIHPALRCDSPNDEPDQDQHDRHTNVADGTLGGSIDQPDQNAGEGNGQHPKRDRNAIVQGDLVGRRKHVNRVPDPVHDQRNDNEPGKPAQIVDACEHTTRLALRIGVCHGYCPFVNKRLIQRTEKERS